MREPTLRTADQICDHGFAATEERPALERVAELARDWFVTYLAPAGQRLEH